MMLIAENAAKARYSHMFCAIQRGGSASDALQGMGAPTFILGAEPLIPSWSALRMLSSLIRQLRPHVLHLHGAEANFHGVLAGRLAQVAVVLAEEIGLPQHSPWARRAFRQIYRRCDRVVAISEAVKNSLIETGEAVPEHVEVIYNPVAVQPERPFPKRDGALQLGFVGRLEPVKNPMAAVEAMALLRDRGIDSLLRVVGDGSEGPRLKQRISELGLQDRIELMGFRPRPFEVLDDCHLYLQPSLSEGFGLAICEAMTAGLPVIASGVGGAQEIVENGVTGWLLPSPEPGPLADLIEEAWRNDETKLSTIAQRARASVIARFAPVIYLQNCEALYDRFVRDKLVA